MIDQRAMQFPRRSVTPAMVAKVIDVLKLYAEGGTIREAIDGQGLMRGDYYAVLRAHPDLDQIYKDIQRDRADMMVDEAYQIGTDDINDPRVARVKAEIRMKIAAAYDRKRFGEKVDLTIENRVDLRAVIAGVEARALPWRDLRQAVDVTPTPQLTDQAAQLEIKPADTPSVAPAIGDAAARRRRMFDD